MNRTQIAVATLALTLVAGAFAAGQATAQDVPNATCQIMDWRPLAPKKSMEEFETILSAHATRGETQVMPLSSGGGTTGFMVCSW